MVKCTRFLLQTLFLLCFCSYAKAQVANFTANKTQGCSPLVVVFTNTSTGATSYSWDFGNLNTNTTTTLAPQTATYNKAGTYTVKLIASNGGSSNTKTMTITVFSNPTAKFTTADTSGCFPFTSKFTDQSTPGSGAINAWSWAFGDGFNNTTQNPTHTYNGSGSYNVTLVITDVNGCKGSITKPASIKVVSSDLAPAFTPSPTIGCKAPSTINFSNTTTGTGSITYKWDFGDTHTSTTTSPSNTYTTAGTYTVSLTASTSGGCSKTATSTMTVLGASSVAFKASDTIFCIGTTTSFSDLTSPTPTAWSWDFGDGSGVSSAQNPNHLYAAAGTYKVKLTVTFAGLCTDSLVKNAYIVVNPKPVINFSADTTHACSVPFNVKFTDNTVGAAKWTWYFGDSNTPSNLQNPTHSYATSGNDSVKLIVTTTAGCVDSITKLNYIDIQLPNANFFSDVTQGCVPLTVNFNGSGSSPGYGAPIVSYSWDFGDPASGVNNTSTLTNPQHIYNNTGSYDVTLTIVNKNGCTSILKIPTDIIVTTKPIIAFSASPLSACALTPVTFTDASVNGTSWTWDFGTGPAGSQGGGSGAVTTHLYSDTGYFDIQLIVKNIGCPDTLKKLAYIHISPAVPKFSSLLNCSNVLARSFTNLSLGADKWYWNFGDGSPLDSINYSVAHTYPSAGTYTVTLTAVNNSSGCKKDSSLQITLINIMPQFTLAPSSQGCNPVTVNFTDLTTGGTINNPSWDFGDGSTSFGTLTPSHTYTIPGLYTVKHYVMDNYACLDSVVKIDTIKVYDIVPDFYIKRQSGCDSLQVQFRDTSVTNPAATGWAWDFGDGKTSNVQYPVHYYTAAGTYTVTLAVTNSDGTCSVTKNNIVTFVLPVAAFTSSSQLTCPGTNINFTNNSTNANKYSWNYGDATALDNTASPSHTYSSNGAYTVILAAIDSTTGCSDTLKQVNYITIDKPVMGFKTSATLSSCPPMSVSFYDTTKSVSAINFWKWNFGDGDSATFTTQDSSFNTYVAPGKYDVRLIVTNAAGCTDTITKPKLITVNGPNGTYTASPLSGCIPLTVDFKVTLINTISYVLDYGDGNAYNGDTCCLVHTYTGTGIKIPYYTLTDAAGCVYSIPAGDTVTITPYPGANFVYSPSYPKINTAAQFTDKSAAGNTWLWDFGDGSSTSTLQNPTHTYSKSGIYYVKEIVDNGGCIDSMTQKITVVEDLVFPNVFSPNGDGINDTYNLGAYGYSMLEIHIYDRWGIELFYKANEKIFWDGHNMSGQEVPSGTYYYTVVATQLNGETTPFKGFIQLER